MIPTQQQTEQIINEMTHEVKTDRIVFKWNWVELAVWLPYGEKQIESALSNKKRVALSLWNLKQA